MALLLPSTEDIGATVVEELDFMGGTVSDRYDDGRRLFLRALLPMSDEVRPEDVVEGGIAVRTVGQEIERLPVFVPPILPERCDHAASGRDSTNPACRR